MCGDGTNDVGSLKMADVGLAIVNKPEPDKTLKKKTKQMSMWLPRSELAGLTPQQQRERQNKHMQEYMKAMNERMGAGADQVGGSSMPDLGDACIAAPFTYRFSSMKAVKKLIQQGRTTLTTTFQMYKILSLNSLISAYSLSVLYLEGVKMGDYQATCLGMAISVMFLFISFSKPLKNLEKPRPPVSIFHWTLTLSVSIQFAMHLSVIIFLSHLAEPYIDRTDDTYEPDGEFKPNVINSIIFLQQWWLQCSVIVVNYQGRPFMQDIRENKGLYRYIFIMFSVAIVAILDMNDLVREYLQLVPFPNEEFQFTVIGALVGDFMFCYMVELMIKKRYLASFE